MQIDRRTFLFGSAALAAARRSSAASTTRRDLPFRQVHLDFHTSELIPDIGAGFDGREFAATLKAAHVNSINVFAKCHHGYAYYPTTVGTPHPHLKKDLLGGMIEALKPSGIPVIYYYSLVWDVNQSRKHPEWLMVDSKGEPMTGMPKERWPSLCLNTPYFDQVLVENSEILKKYSTGGAFFDILKQPPDGCHCKWCIEDRRRLGLNIPGHNKHVALKVEKALADLIRAQHPDATTFFNSRLVIGVRDELPYYSHVELESLPTGGWGYTHFQQRVRYYRTLGKDMVGMTGRFHKSWGDFGGLKNQAALDYECLNFLANGTKVCIGDQLHPRGRLDATTYRRIGKTYEKIAALEPWARGAEPVADIGVISTAAVDSAQSTQKIPIVDQGFTNMLVELHHQFDILDLESDLTPYQVVILPDEIGAVSKLSEKVSNFLARGGGLIATHNSFATKKLLGARVLGPSKYEGEYMILRRAQFPDIEENAYFLYQRGNAIEAGPGTEVLATYGHPYFDRSAEHYSSHRQTPLAEVTEEPMITKTGNVIYVANPFFRSYAQDGYGIYKQVMAELIRKLLPNPAILAPNLPSTAQLTLMKQPSRHVVHVLHYPLTRRAPDIDIIEEPGLLENVQLKLRLERRPARVMLAPQSQPLAFEYSSGYASCVVPRILGHQAIAFEI